MEYDVFKVIVSVKDITDRGTFITLEESHGKLHKVKLSHLSLAVYDSITW